MKNTRHLAVILFTELDSPPTGNTTKDQDSLTQLRRQYHEILTAQHDIFKGHIVNFFGNGSMSLFRCTLDAVRCARAMQQEFQRMGIGNVRMGLHIGEVLNEKEDVSGPSVNLAARIQALGIPGSVLFSDIVYAQIRNQPEFDIIPLGRFPVKNISGKVRTYALKEKGIVAPTRQEILRHQRKDVLKSWLSTPLQAVVGLSRFMSLLT